MSLLPACEHVDAVKNALRLLHALASSTFDKEALLSALAERALPLLCALLSHSNDYVRNFAAALVRAPPVVIEMANNAKPLTSGGVVVVGAQ